MIIESRCVEATRRRFLTTGAGAATLAIAGCAGRDPEVARRLAHKKAQERSWAYYRQLYGSVQDGGFIVPTVDLQQVEPKYFRREVANETGFPSGTLVVNTKTFYLYWTQPDGTAMRYGVGLGRAGFSWSGRGVIQYKRRWPTWTPPTEMIERQPELEKFSAENGGQPPGINNPLGARALYIFQDGADTLYRVHGSPEAFSIGKAVSSGCVRLLNQDIIDLYERVPDGSSIHVI